MKARVALAAGLLAVAAGCTRDVTPFVEDPEVLQLRHPAEGEELVGNFAGRIPCAKCDKIKLLLSLFQRVADHAPTRYQLERVGEDGNARLTTRGQWTKSAGRSGDPGSATIQLDAATPAQFTRYLSLDSKVLLMLDDSNALKVGNGAWSYTLDHVDLAYLDSLTP